MSAHPPGASLHCEDAVGGGQRFSQSISGLIELFSTIGHKGAEYPGQRSVEQGAAHCTVQYSTVQGAARHISRHCGAARDNGAASIPRDTRPGCGDNEAATYTPIYPPVSVQSKCEVPPLASVVAVSSVRSPH